MEIKDTVLREMMNEATSSSRKQLRIMVTLMVVLGGGGGAWMSSSRTEIQQAVSTQADWTAKTDEKMQIVDRHDKEIARQSERIEAISILLVQQGRYFENMVRSVAPRGSKLPDRPAALDAIEQQILRREGR